MMGMMPLSAYLPIDWTGFDAPRNPPTDEDFEYVLNSLNNSRDFDLGSEKFPFNYEKFFKDHGYSLVGNVDCTGGGQYSITKDVL